MPYLFTCPHCQTATWVDDQYSGRSGHCVACEGEIAMPDFEPAASAPRSDRMGVFRLAIVVTFAVGIVGLIALGVLRYGAQGMRTIEANRMRGQCIRNLEKIAQAMNAYADDYGSYPPPVTVAADGTPLHSWRVTLLPYLGYPTLYDEFAMDQPWDSVANRQLVYQMPREYRSPVASATSGYETYYTLITGAGTLFPPAGPLGPADVSDDPAKTLLVVEATRPTSLSLQWTEPGDLDFATLSTTIGSDLGGHHQGGATAVTVDGRGQWLRDGLEPAVVRALITPRGGEGLPDDVLD